MGLLKSIAGFFGIQTGNRGGKYYINSHGNKEYGTPPTAKAAAPKPVAARRAPKAAPVSQVKPKAAPAAKPTKEPKAKKEPKPKKEKDVGGIASSKASASSEKAAKTGTAAAHKLAAKHHNAAADVWRDKGASFVAGVHRKKATEHEAAAESIAAAKKKPPVSPVVAAKAKELQAQVKQGIATKKAAAAAAKAEIAAAPKPTPAPPAPPPIVAPAIAKEVVKAGSTNNSIGHIPADSPYKGYELGATIRGTGPHAEHAASYIASTNAYQHLDSIQRKNFGTQDELPDYLARHMHREKTSNALLQSVGGIDGAMALAKQRLPRNSDEALAHLQVIVAAQHAHRFANRSSSDWQWEKQSIALSNVVQNKFHSFAKRFPKNKEYSGVEGNTDSQAAKAMADHYGNGHHKPEYAKDLADVRKHLTGALTPDGRAVATPEHHRQIDAINSFTYQHDAMMRALHQGKSPAEVFGASLNYDGSSLKEGVASLFRLSTAEAAMPHLETFMKTAPVATTEYVHRGIKGLSEKTFENFRNSKNVVFDAVSSTSASYEAASGFASTNTSHSVIFSIKHKSARAIEPMSDIVSEHELLLNRGAKFNVTKVTELSRTQIHLEMEEI